MRADSFSSKTRLVRLLDVGGCGLLTAILLAFAGLVGVSHWRYDEFVEFAAMREETSYFLHRLLWSPRPVSEPILVTYGWLANTLHRPLTTLFLAFLWTIFFAAGLLAFQQKRHAAEGHAGLHLLLALTLMAVFTSGGNIIEVFYWPMGAVAYLPTLAACLLLFLQTANGMWATATGRHIGCLCLTVAAGSSETGAIFVLCYAVMQVLRMISSRKLKGETSSREPILWWAVPALVSLVVLLFLGVVRARSAELPQFANSPIKGHPVLSLLVGVVELIAEAIGKDMITTLPGSHFDPLSLIHDFLASRLPMEILLGAGIALAWSRLGKMAAEQASRLRELAAAFLLAALATVTAANVHFGAPCCPRHEVLRECWIVLAIAALSMALHEKLTESQVARLHKYSFLAPVLLCAAVLSLHPIERLAETYRIYGQLRATNEQNFESGLRSGESRMIYVIPPSTAILSDIQPVPGSYSSYPGEPSGFVLAAYPYGLLHYFGKQSIVILAPGDAPASPHTAVPRLCTRCLADAEAAAAEQKQ